MVVGRNSMHMYMYMGTHLAMPRTFCFMQVSAFHIYSLVHAHTVHVHVHVNSVMDCLGGTQPCDILHTVQMF